MYAEERRRQIASMTAVEERVNVTELAYHFAVTAETIRRDLAVLDREGLVNRVHGGAVAAQTFQTTELSLDARLRSAPGAKSAIARAAADFLPSRGGSVFLDAGTTTNALADLIAQRREPDDLSIVSNSLPICLALARHDVKNVQLLGGRVRAITQAVVGSTALRTLALMRADVAFVGTNALTIDHGLSTADAKEAAIKSTFITNSNKVVVLCDSSKLGNNYLVSFGSISDIDVVVTDADVPAHYLNQLRERDVTVVVAQPDGEAPGAETSGA